MDNVKDNATMMSAMKATAKELKAAYKELDIDGLLSYYILLMVIFICRS